MKKLLILAAFCLPFALWAQTAQEGAGHYTVNVAAVGDVAKVELTYPSPDGTGDRTDTAVLTDGVYVFEGEVDEPLRATLAVFYAVPEDAQPDVYGLILTLEPGVITVNIPEDRQSAKAVGTVTNEEMNYWGQMLAALSNEMRTHAQWYMGLTPEQQKIEGPQAQAQAKGIADKRAEMIRDYVTNNPDSWYALRSLYNELANKRDVVNAQLVLDGFSDRLKSSRLGRQRQAEIDEWKQFGPGATAPDFSQADPDGNQIKLSDLRGKWVLIDFWASWCGPCRQENPNVVAAFEKFKDKGFTVFGVSLDTNREAWLKAIAADHLDWPHVSDLQGWKNEVAKLYQVNSVPTNFLVGPDGVIIARDLRAEALHAELEKLLGAE